MNKIRIAILLSIFSVSIYAVEPDYDKSAEYWKAHPGECRANVQAIYDKVQADIKDAKEKWAQREAKKAKRVERQTEQIARSQNGVYQLNAEESQLELNILGYTLRGNSDIKFEGIRVGYFNSTTRFGCGVTMFSYYNLAGCQDGKVTRTDPYTTYRNGRTYTEYTTTQQKWNYGEVMGIGAFNFSFTPIIYKDRFSLQLFYSLGGGTPTHAPDPNSQDSRSAPYACDIIEYGATFQIDRSMNIDLVCTHIDYNASEMYGNFNRIGYIFPQQSYDRVTVGVRWYFIAWVMNAQDVGDRFIGGRNEVSIDRVKLPDTVPGNVLEGFKILTLLCDILSIL